MKTCPKCGREITDPKRGCTLCNLQESLEGNPYRHQKSQGSFSDKFHSGNVAQKPTAFDENRNQQLNQNEAIKSEANEYRHADEIPLALKIIAVIFILAARFSGIVGGFLIGVGLCANGSSESYKKFGKLLIAVSALYLVFMLFVSILFLITGGIL